VSSTISGEAARLELMPTELHLPTIKSMRATIAAQSDKQGWPAAGLLASLAEHEIADRSRRRIERHLAEARLPIGKTFDSFEFEAVPVVSNPRRRSWRSLPATAGCRRILTKMAAAVAS
jgi:DNA replication protein DnaC